MTDVHELRVQLTSEMIAMLEAAVGTGEYTSPSEVIREALRTWKAGHVELGLDTNRLRQLWQEGLSSGQPLQGEQVFDRLRVKYTAT